MIEELAPYGEPSQEQKREFLELVEARDGKGLFYLISQKYVYVLWGGFMRTLSDEDQSWVREATDAASRR